MSNELPLEIYDKIAWYVDGEKVEIYVSDMTPSQIERIMDGIPNGTYIAVDSKQIH